MEIEFLSEDEFEEDVISDNENMYFPVLYNKEKGRKWKIWVEQQYIYRTDGLSKKDFVKKPSCREAKTKAHTTAEEQAILDAKSLWTKKLDQAFAPLSEDEEGQDLYNEIMENKKRQGGNNHGVSRKQKGALKTNATMQCTIQNLDKTYTAMLAHKYNEKKSRIIWDFDEKDLIIEKLRAVKKKKYKTLDNKEVNKLVNEDFRTKYFDASDGVFVQTKLDGVRCIAFCVDDKIALVTRTGKQIVHLSHIRKQLKVFLKNYENVVLDGELYVHHPIVHDEELLGNDRFNFISSACRTTLTKPNLYEHLIQYHVFDIVDAPPFGSRAAFSGTQTLQIERLTLLKKLFTNYNKVVHEPCIIPVELQSINSEDELLQYHTIFFKNDYEGVILRDPNGYYVGKRALHLLKYKEFEDDEFLIVGAKSAEGTEEGAVVWICEIKSGEQFQCRMRGSVAKRRELYENYTDYLGQMLTVRYQEIGKNGIPRFPVGIAIRDYE